MMVGGSTAVVLSGVLSRAMLMVSPIFMRILLLAFFGAALGAGEWLVACVPPPSVLVALFRMVGRPGTRAVTVAPRGHRWCRLLARCAWLALAVAVLVAHCRLGLS